MAEIFGEVAPRFTKVLDAFTENFEARGEVGASVCVWHEGRKVVDLWGGVADPVTQRPWTEDTIGLMFSATKGLAATALLMLADRGVLDLDATVATYWPAFAQAGKASMTVRTLLNHRGGLCALDRPLSLDDLEDPVNRVAPVLEAQAPMWAPGSAQGYHAISFGPYVAELFRRVAGRTVGDFLRTEITGPLGADLFLGLPPEATPRVARLLPTTGRDKLTRLLPAVALGYGVEGRLFRSFLDPRSATRAAFSVTPELGARSIETFNAPRVHRMEMPWANGIGNARGLARVYAALAHGGSIDGVRLVSREILREVEARQSWGFDRVLCKPMGFSLGFVKEEPHLFSPTLESFGHPGLGGSLGWADGKRNLSIGYVMNQMTWKLRSPKALALCHAVYASL